LQDQDYLFFQDQSCQDQDHFFKTKTAFFKNHIKLLTQDLKKRSLAEKIRPVVPVLTSHAGIMPVTEKTCLLPAF